MSHIIQSTAIQGWNIAISTGVFALESIGLKSLLDLNASTANVQPLTLFPNAYFVRQDRKDRNRVVRIFDSKGSQKYSIERLSSTHPVWSLITFPQRNEIATINVSFTKMSVDFHNKPGLSHRQVKSEFTTQGRFYSFCTNDGIKYSWSRGSKFLEKIINPNCGHEEVRKRIAKAKLMRQFKLDFELLIDEQEIDPEIVLATSFISMICQWGIGDVTDTVGPTYIPNKPTLNPTPSPEDHNDSEKIVVVIDNNDNNNFTVETF